MKKRALAVLLQAAVISSLLAGCGAEKTIVPVQGTDAGSEAEVLSEESEASSGIDPTELLQTLLKKQGSVYQIYTYDRKLVDVMDRFFPDYLTEEEMEASAMESEASEMTAAADSTVVTDVGLRSSDEESKQEVQRGADGEELLTGQIGEITITWHIVEQDLNRYQDILDEALMNPKAEQDEQVDLFLVDGELAAKYCDADADVAKPLSQIGLTERDLSQQYGFTKVLASDANGVQRGCTWQVPCGLFVYRRSIARELLGTDNPVQIQNEVRSWDRFNELAEAISGKQYQLLSGYTDAFRAYLNQREKGWVNDADELQIDPVMARWVTDTKSFSESGFNNGTDGPYSEAWQKDQKADSRVFGFFLSSWGLGSYLLPDSLETAVENGGELIPGNGSYGDWAVCQGPDSFYQGGSWLCAARNSDNDELTATIMKMLTCDGDVMRQITIDTGELTNNMEAMSRIPDQEVALAGLVGGQNYLRIYDQAARKLDVSQAGLYDSGINRIFIDSFLPYFRDETDESTALAAFYQEVMTSYPDLLSA